MTSELVEPDPLDPEQAELVLQINVERGAEHAFLYEAVKKLRERPFATLLTNSGVSSIRLRQPLFAGELVPWEIRLGFATLPDLAGFLDETLPDSRGSESEVQAERSPDTSIRLEARESLLRELRRLEQMRGVQVVHSETNAAFRTWGLTIRSSPSPPAAAAAEEPGASRRR